METRLKTKVLIVDDSAMVRAYLKRELSSADDIEVVGTAADPFQAREEIARLRPDVMTLDIEMPRMDGLTFLSKVMQHFPIPTVIYSSLTAKGSAIAYDALQVGAVEVVCKGSSAYSASESRQELIRAVHSAALARVERRPAANAAQTASRPIHSLALRATTHQVVAIGASTGGTVAIETLLRQLPPGFPGTVIAQHMPREFTALFAQRLAQVTGLRIREAWGDEIIQPGDVFIAPGGRHLKVVRQGGQYLTRLSDEPPVHFQKPSCDILFKSVAVHCGRNAVGAILTGMGADGAEGLLAMRQAGAHTLGQDEQTSVVYGMPKAAYDMGAVVEVRPLDLIVPGIVQALQRPRT